MQKIAPIDFNDRNICDEKGALLNMRNNDKIDSYNADINMIVGKRSNGKTYPTLVFNGIKMFIDSGYKKNFAYVRRFESNLKDIREDLFNSPQANGWLEWYSKGEWNNIYYYRGKWYLRRVNDEGVVEKKCPIPLCYAFALNKCESYKGPDYVTIKMVLFDEFIPMKETAAYIPGEWKLWQNLISTIVRNRGDVKIYMIANTLSLNCIYFDKYKVDMYNMEQGTISIYKFKSGGVFACEYVKDAKEVTPVESVKYFDEDDKSGNAITTGAFETSEYDRLPKKYRKYKNFEVGQFFVRQGNHILHAHILDTGELPIIFFHEKTTPIKYKTDIIYSETTNSEMFASPYYRVGFSSSRPLDKTILKIMAQNRCAFSKDMIGELLKYFMNNTR